MTTPAINLRQTSFVGYETLVNAGEILDEPTVDNNWIGLYQRIYDVMPVGVTLPYLGSDSPSGWIIADGSTIGNVSSAANSTSASYIRLFTLLWNQCIANPASALVAEDASSNPINFASSPVSASVAWTGLYIITLPNLQDKFPIGIYSAGLAPAFNTTGGAKTVNSSHTHSNTLSLNTVAAHNHGTVSGTTSSAGGFTPTGTISMDAISSHTHTLTDPGHLHALTLSTATVTAGEGLTVVLATPTVATATTGITIVSAGGVTPTGTFTGNAVSGHTHTFSGTMADAGAHTHTISGGVSSGGSTTLATVPPFYGLNFIIKYSWGL